MFLGYMRVPSNKLIVEWGERIIIPAVEESFLDNDVIIPIDSSGRALIPLAGAWGESFKKNAIPRPYRFL